MKQREVQQSLKKVIARKESCNARKDSGASLPQSPATRGLQISSALIGLLCRPAEPNQPTRTLPGKVAEVTPTSAGSHRKLTAAGDNIRVNAEHSGSTAGQAISTPSATAATSWQECPLCQQQVFSHDLQRHINAELDGIMSASTTSQPAAGASFNSHASARSTHLQEAAVAEQQIGEVNTAGSRSAALAYSTVERWNSATHRGLPPRSQSLGSCSDRGSLERQQHGSQRAQRHADRGVPGNPGTEGPSGHINTAIVHRQPVAAMHDSKLLQEEGGVAASTDACRRQCSRENLVATGARSGAAQGGQARDALQSRKRLDKRPELRTPPAKVLILGAGKVDQPHNPELKRVKAPASRWQPGQAAVGSFDHYHTGNGLWDSSMLGLDGAENLGIHMWEGVGTATWSGLGPP